MEQCGNARAKPIDLFRAAAAGGSSTHYHFPPAHASFYPDDMSLIAVSVICVQKYIPYTLNIPAHFLFDCMDDE
jgi:hypothetical protein